MCIERGGGRMEGDGRGTQAEFVAGDEDIVVGGAAAFGSDDVGEVGFSDFIDDPNKAFVPAGFVVFWGRIL